MSESRSKTTLAQSLVTGSVAGATEVLVDHPLWVIKTRMQSGQPFSLNHRILYRGIVPNASSMIPSTALQVGFNRGFQEVLFKNTADLSNTQRLGSAFMAGMASSFVSCPTEMVMTYQGKMGGGFYQAGKQIVSQGGYRALFTGLLATALREGKFTAFFLGVTPMLKAQIQPHCSNDYTASLLAGMGAGVGATLASQGFDTLKTIQQTADLKKPMSFVGSVKKLYGTNGAYGFFKGGIPRGTRVMSAVTIMGFVADRMDTKFREYNAEQSVASDKRYRK